MPTPEWFIDEIVVKAVTGSADAIDIVEALALHSINVRPNYSRLRSTLNTSSEAGKLISPNSGRIGLAFGHGEVSYLPGHL